MTDISIERKLGAKIAYLRKLKHLSQEKMAEKVDISEIYMGQIERGEANPTLDKLKAIAKVLDIEIKELFDFTL